MKITIDIKRLLLTMTVCIVAAILPLTVTTTESFYPFIVPLLFSIAVTLTSFDRIITKRKYQAFLLSILLTTLLFFISVMIAVALGQSFLGDYAVIVVCLLAGLITLIIFSLVIKIENIIFGLIVTGLLSVSAPFLSKLIRGQKFLNIELFGDPATFFIIWQTVIGLALAISIWTNTGTRKENN